MMPGSRFARIAMIVVAVVVISASSSATVAAPFVN